MAQMSPENKALRESGKKRCGTCNAIKSLDEYTFRKPRIKKSSCSDCVNANNRRYYKKNQVHISARSRAYYATWKDVYWQRVLIEYGGRCFCCSETNPDLLTIDHINNDGHLENKYGRTRGGRALWARLRHEDYPKDRYRLACFNCNCGRARRRDKICPHKITEIQNNSGQEWAPVECTYPY